MYKIQKNIPIPNKDNNRRYPFHKMKKGDSFLVKRIEEKSVRNCLTMYGRKHNQKFIARVTESKKAVRVWRIK